MALRAASSLAPSLRQALTVQRAAISTSQRPMDLFKDKEKGDESIHFRKEVLQLCTFSAVRYGEVHGRETRLLSAGRAAPVAATSEGQGGR